MDPGSERRLAAILFTDVVGSTAVTARSESAGLALRDRHRDLVRRQVSRYRGRLIEAAGDESLSTFESAVDAVHAALAIQRELEGESELRVRVGIHTGETIFRGGEVFGDGVNIAARIRELAEPGQILVSGEVARSIHNQPDVNASPRGEHELKGVEGSVWVHAVSGSAAEPSAARHTMAASRRVPVWSLGLASVALLALCGGIAWWLQGATPASGLIRSIAVLPLENLSGDPEQEYFADGMTEALIADLAKIASLRVISRTSVMQYKGARKPLPEIAEELDVDAIVEGSVLRVGDRVRITAQLVHAPTDHHLWAESYQRGMDDVLGLQSEVARAIAQEIRVTLTPGEKARLASPRAVNPDAHQAYLKGRAHWMRGGSAYRQQGLGYFQQAIQIDPGYAPGHAGLSDAYSSLALSGAAPPVELMPKAEAAALKALELDDTLPEAHLSLGAVRMYYDWDFAAAEREFRRALELNPSHALAHLWLGLSLSISGRSDEALEEASLATRYDPMSSAFLAGSALLHRNARDFDGAETLVREALALDPSSAFAHRVLGSVYSLTSRHEEAIVEIEKTGARAEGGPLWDLGYVYARAGREEEARAILQELNDREEYVPATSQALIYAGLGDRDEAFGWLERAYVERSIGLVFVDSPTWDSLRADPRFDHLLQRMNLAN